VGVLLDPFVEVDRWQEAGHNLVWTICEGSKLCELMYDQS
jgi:hypothetical protein